MSKVEINTKQEIMAERQGTPASSSTTNNEKGLRNILRIKSKRVFRELEDVAKSEWNFGSSSSHDDK